MIRRKKYNFRKGDIIDVEEFHDGRYGAPGEKRQKRVKPTQEQIRIVNAQNKAKRCRQKMLAYFKRGDILATWTYEVENRPPTMQDALKDFQKAKEKVVPVITITAPTASQYLANSTPAIAWKITDDDSGVNPSTIALKIDGTAVDTSKIKKTAVTGGYTCSYTPTSALSDGAHTVVATASDYDGNAAAQKSVTFTVDTIPPTLSISAPAEGFITNKSTVTVKGTTDDATSKPVTVTVNGAPIPVTPSGTFSNDVTLKEGSNTITIVAKDKAGKTTTVTRTVKLDTAPPVIKSATITPNPVDCGKTFVISVEVTD